MLKQFDGSLSVSIDFDSLRADRNLELAVQCAVAWGHLQDGEQTFTVLWSFNEDLETDYLIVIHPQKN